MSKLLLLFIVVPIVELQLLILVHDQIGFGNTILLVLFTGVMGARLAKREGFSVLRQIQEKLSRGETPTTELSNGAIILVGGVLLITPGVLTDVFGFTCLIPMFRKLYINLISKLFKTKINVVHHSNHSNDDRGKRVDVDWNEID